MVDNTKCIYYFTTFHNLYVDYHNAVRKLRVVVAIVVTIREWYIMLD